MVHIQPFFYCIRVVVLALNKGAAADVTLALYLGLLIQRVVRGAAAFADTASGHAGDDVLVRHLDVEDSVDFHAHLVQSLGLGDGPGEAVQDEPVLAVLLGQAVLDDADEDFIGHQLAALHIGLGLQAHLRAAFQRFAENVPRRDGGDVVFLADLFRLGALPGPGRA